MMMMVESTPTPSHSALGIGPGACMGLRIIPQKPQCSWNRPWSRVSRWACHPVQNRSGLQYEADLCLPNGSEPIGGAQVKPIGASHKWKWSRSGAVEPIQKQVFIVSLTSGQGNPSELGNQGSQKKVSADVRLLLVGSTPLAGMSRSAHGFSCKHLNPTLMGYL